jgi:shikimate kinase/3-dehydroquinate synthase
MIDTLVLAGLSGTGKSTIGAQVARQLGWTLVDTDEEIQRTTGVSIPEIFEREGETSFRRYERVELLKALDKERVVIATGGGAVIADDAWTPDVLGREGTLVVTLEASAEIVHKRLEDAKAKHGDSVRRPLLDAVNSLERVREMKAARAGAYARSHVTIPVDHRSIAETSDDLVELVSLFNATFSRLEVDLPGVHSTIVVGRGSRRLLPEVLRSEWPKARRIWIAADANVIPHADELRRLLESDGFGVETRLIPSGESEKSFAGLTEMYDWLLGNGVQRQDVLIALGGGKVGDLAGFAAATVLRGVGLVQIPTTLLAMVDSSIGGKTAINHPTGKNLIGAFYQPAHVLVDPELLLTVPPRELTSGWAEVIKHGEIQRSTPGGDSGHLRDVLTLNHERLTKLEDPVLSWVIRQNLTIKAAVVTEDEREAGLRAILNYGHTIGHAIEASGYRYLHGEAISVGLVAAVRLAVEMGRIDRSEIDRIERTLTSFGLPIRAEAQLNDVLARTASDKKKSSGNQQWVLANSDGRVTIETDVPPGAIEIATRDVLG